MGWYEKLFGKSNAPLKMIEEINPEKPFYHIIPEYIYKAPEYLVNATVSLVTQPVAIFHAGQALWAHEPSRVIGKSLLEWETITRIAPLIIVNAGINFFSTGLDQNASILTVDGMLGMALTTLNIGINLFAVASLLKSSITTLCAPAAFHQISAADPKIAADCTSECQGTLVLLNGAVHATAAYYSNLMLVQGLELLSHTHYPLPDKLFFNLAKIASVYASGRYIAGLSNPRCREHQFLKSEMTLTLGIMHKGLEYLLWLALTASTGELAPILMLTLNDIPLLLIILIARHQVGSALVTKDNRTLIDPLEMYENFVRKVLEFFSPGIKAIITKLLQGPPSNIPWANYANETLTLFQNPLISFILLPKMLHNWDNFIHEPMISPRWTVIQNQMVSILSTLEEASQSRVVSIAARAPGKAASLIQYLFGFPRPVAKVLLNIMSNEQYMQMIEALRRWFQVHAVKKDTGLGQLAVMAPLRTLDTTPSTGILLKNEVEKSPEPIVPDPNKFFKTAKKQAVPVHDVGKYLVGSNRSRGNSGSW